VALDGDVQLHSVLREYNLEPDRIIQYGNVFKVDAGQGKYALKVVKGYPPRLLFSLAAMDYLRYRGFTGMARLIKSVQDELYVISDDELFFLTPWIDGRYINLLNLQELQIGVQLLAQMHMKGEGFIPPRESEPRNDIGRWTTKWARRIKDLEQMEIKCREENDEFSTVFKQVIQRAVYDAYTSLQSLHRFGYTEYCKMLEEKKPLCHRDFVYHNVIFTGAEAFLIDFEYCVLDSRITDLARLIRAGWEKHPWEVDRAIKIISFYHQSYPLTEIEYCLLWAVMLFPHNIWRVGHNWFLGGQRKESLIKAISQECLYYPWKWEILSKIKPDLTPSRS